MTGMHSRVLVADDDTTVRLLAAAALSAHRFDVHTVEDGRSAWEALCLTEYDLVLLDVEMPGMDGFALCERIRAEMSRDIPVLLVTGHDDVESIQRAYNVGATDFVSKPINWPLLGHRLRYVLRSYRTLQLLDNAKARHRAMLRALPDALLRVTTTGDVIEQHGPQFGQDVGIANALHTLFPKEVADLCLDCVRQAVETGNVQNIEYALGDGAQPARIIEGRIAPVDSDEAICLLRDVTERREADRQIVNLAYFDPLTGLPNRTSFQAELKLSVERAKRESTRLAVLFLDIDGFKAVNDSFGHTTGDHMLQAVSERLRTTLRVSDSVGRQTPFAIDSNAPSLSRLGGDEFIVLLPDVSKAEDAMLIAQRICATFAKAFVVDGQEIVLSTSVGISVFPDDAASPQLLLKHADTAMYAAKERGRSQAHFYSEALTERATRRFKMETALRLALEREEFMVHYQPIVETRTDQVCSFEALVRWNHPELGVLSPSEFITIAEECGLISKLGRWVLRRACEDAVRWNQGGHPPISVAVNVSALQIGERTLVDAVISTLKHTRLPPELLELELTESALLNRENSSIASMQLLHQLGVRFALDDFGTGYSSLASLRELPLSTLKIDRLFVTDLPSSESDAAIVRSIIALSQNLGLRVIGEGVENTLQVQKLTAMGCGNLQGFLFGKPSPYAEAVALARARRLISVA